MEDSDNDQLPIKFASVIDRYYTRHHLKLGPEDLMEVGGTTCPNEGCLDQFYYFHSNKVVLFGLSEKHAAVVNHATDPILEIKWVGDRMAGISGKRKQGAISLEYASIICEVVTAS